METSRQYLGRHWIKTSLCKLCSDCANCSESFAAPNPNDDIPTAPAPVQDDTPQLPSETIPVEALDTPRLGEADETEGSLDINGRPIPTEELFVKDAFLVFRALCKLSMKPLVTEK